MQMNQQAIEQTLRGYRGVLRRRTLVLLVLLLCALTAFLVDLLTGPSALSPAEALRGILSPDSLSRTDYVILWQVRMPAAVMALLVGVALALAGAEMQTILDNPLASPFTLGVSHAAAFGAAIGIVLGASFPAVPLNWTISVNAFVFAFASTLLIQLVARYIGASAQTLVLFGIAMFFTFEALVKLMQFIASEQALQQLVFWTMGNLGRADWTKISYLAAAIALTAPFTFRASWKMTALRMGDERAKSFGVRVERLRLVSLLRVAVFTSFAVAFVGTIGFIGLVAPHIARLLVGEDHRFLFPASALAGAFLMSAASVGSKTILPGVIIPIGIVTALIGVPFFMWLVFRRKYRS